MAKKSMHTIEQVIAFIEELQIQTDRGIAIVAAAVVEDALEHLIHCRLVAVSNTRLDSLFGRMKPLSTFSAKIELGLTLGLYDDNLRSVLDMIRDVRNEFAHEFQTKSFSDPPVAKLVAKARMPSVPKNLSPKDTFMMLFSGAITLIYGTAAADVRIKPLSETHPQIFTNLFYLATTLYVRTESTKKTELATLPDQATPTRPKDRN
jgi:DNA-binding MltR family transcriptional regulator